MYRHSSRHYGPAALPVTLLFPTFAVLVAAIYLGAPGEVAAHPYLRLVRFAALLVLACTFTLISVLVFCCRSCHGRAQRIEADTSFASISEVHSEEWKAIQERRKLASTSSQWLCVLSCPGGGIRQANFVSGVILALVAQPEKNECRPLWRHVDIITAVSGGGYAASSMVSHLLDTVGNFDLSARKAAAHSARLLRVHSNWPLERNWPRMFDDVVGDSCFGCVYNVAFIVGFGIVQFVVPFILLWSLVVVLLPVTLVITIDVPQKFPGHSDCRSWSAWWLASKNAVGLVAALFTVLYVIYLLLSRRAGRLQAEVNKMVDRNDEQTGTLIQLVVRHARTTSGAHLVGAILGACVFAWLFAGAYAVAGFNCGIFFASDLKYLDISLLGSVVLLLVMTQSRISIGMLPAACLALVASLMYAASCVHFDAWLRSSGCDVHCCPRTLGGRFLDRGPFFAAVVLWGLHPIAHNTWSFLMPRWYSWKLSRYLKDEWLCFGDLREAYRAGSHAPYMLMCCAVHQIWKLPLRGLGNKLERLASSTFIYSPLFVGDRSLGFVSTGTMPHASFRVAGAAATSGAATSNQFHHLLPFFSGLLFGAWVQFEPDSKDQHSPGNWLLMFGFALMHFVGAAALLLGYELCTYSPAPPSKPPLVGWSCPEEGHGYVVCGLVFLFFELCVLPVFITWAKPIWRTPWFGKWLSEWMQLQAFSFPHGAETAGGVPRHVYLSDGGHIDNLGILEALRRKSRVILCPHAGFTPTHLISHLRRTLRAAGEDAAIYGAFAPLAWEDGRFTKVPGSIERAFEEFTADMEKSVFLVGVEYGTQRSNPSGSPPPFKNTWGLLVCTVNRPPSAAQCASWGVAAPSQEHLEQVDAKLCDRRLLELLSCAEEQDPRSATSDTHPFLAGSATDGLVREDAEAGIEELHGRAGICWSCCHRLPRRFGGCLRRFGGFPNHHTIVQCFTPELAKDYQRLGFAVVAMHQAMMDAAFSLLSDCEAKPPWNR